MPLLRSGHHHPTLPPHVHAGSWWGHFKRQLSSMSCCAAQLLPDSQCATIELPSGLCAAEGTLLAFSPAKVTQPCKQQPCKQRPYTQSCWDQRTHPTLPCLLSWLRSKSEPPACYPPCLATQLFCLLPCLRSMWSCDGRRRQTVCSTRAGPGIQGPHHALGQCACTKPGVQCMPKQASWSVEES